MPWRLFFCRSGCVKRNFLTQQKRRPRWDKQRRHKHENGGLMDSSLQVFTNEDFGSVRAFRIDNEPWFVAKDVAVSLGYSNPAKAVRDHIDPEDRTVNDSFTVNGTSPTLINESGIYSLILTSKLPNARKFKRWVTNEVLPAIRRDGGYMVARDETPEQTMARAVLIAQQTIERQNKQIEEMRPKAVFADAVSVSKTTILVGDLAKILKQNGFEVGANRLFGILREQGYLCKQKGAMWNMPTQRSMELGLFVVKETTITHSDGHSSINKTPKVTGKGQIYFINRFCKATQAV